MLERDVMTLILFYLKNLTPGGCKVCIFCSCIGTFYILNMLDGNDMNTLHNNCETIEIYIILNMHFILKINNVQELKTFSFEQETVQKYYNIIFFKEFFSILHKK